MFYMRMVLAAYVLKVEPVFPLVKGQWWLRCMGTYVLSTLWSEKQASVPI